MIGAVEREKSGRLIETKKFLLIEEDTLTMRNVLVRFNLISAE